MAGLAALRGLWRYTSPYISRGQTVGYYSSVSTRSSSDYSYRTHTCGELTKGHVGHHVTLCGWIQRPRILGSVGVAFLPLTDSSGTTQVVTQNEDHRSLIKDLPPESVVLIKGKVCDRPTKDINESMVTGGIEVLADEVEVLNSARESLPFFSFSKSSQNVSDEELKLRERYLEIRRGPLQHNLRLRSKVSSIIRDFLINQNFVEVETPTLFKSTPEGANEFIVPTRRRGQFYSLVQSPQQFKQLLMVGGIDRYYQIARCYRDEDQRADRQPEFTQIDLEMSFVTEENVKKLTESLMINLLQKLDLHCPSLPFQSLSYRQAMNIYGTDKPDTRLGMPFQSFTDKWQDAVMHSSMKNSQLKAFPIPQELFGLNEEELHGLVDLKPQNGSIFLCHNGHIEVLADENGSLIEYFNAIGTSATGELMRSVFDSDASYIVGTFNDDMTGDVTLTSLGRVRVNVANLLQKHNFLTPTPQYELLWIVDFPMFNLEEDNDNLVISSAHHPFTAPIPEHQHLLYTSDIMDLSKITSRQYDLVMNGWELGGGSIRIHNATLQEHILKNVLKTDSKTFDHLMRGLESGCPPHGGIALGLDRLMAILCDVTSIREVIAFPKSSQGNDLMVGSPNTLTPDYLSQYFIKPN